MCMFLVDFKRALMPEIIGKRIKEIYLDYDYNNGDGGLVIEFIENNKKIVLFDDARQCCEARYIHCSDDLEWYQESAFSGIKVKNVKDFIDDHSQKHEIQFIHVTTSMGTVVVETHNIHEGHYGGFNLKIDTIDF